MFTQVPGPFSGYISSETKDQLARALAKSRIFQPPNEFTLYPLVSAFSSVPFSFLQPPSLTLERLGIHPRNFFAPDKFPPFGDRGRKEQVASWLGVNAPTFEIEEKRKATILGALALTLPRHAQDVQRSVYLRWPLYNLRRRRNRIVRRPDRTTAYA